MSDNMIYNLAGLLQIVLNTNDLVDYFHIISMSFQYSAVYPSLIIVHVDSKKAPKSSGSEGI